MQTEVTTKIHKNTSIDPKNLFWIEVTTRINKNKWEKNNIIHNKDNRKSQTFSSMPKTISYNLDKISELFSGAYVSAFKDCNLRA